MGSYAISVNGQTHKVEAPEDMPLLWVLRDLLGLYGTKFGCGAGICGTCAVHLDGDLVQSCALPISQVGNKKVLTIEGLSKDCSHPVQKVWNDLDVPQCGYCQSGQIMAAAALLAKKPKPTDTEIDEAMAPHLCRCYTYVRIRKAIKRAAGIKTNDQETFRKISQSTSEAEVRA